MDSRERKLNMETVTVEDDLFDALKAISNFDADFNGTNGDEYLSNEAKEEGFESNQEYLLNQMRKRKAAGEFAEEHDIVEAFCEEWMGSDDYYKEYKVVCHYNENEKVDFIALAFVE